MKHKFRNTLIAITAGSLFLAACGLDEESKPIPTDSKGCLFEYKDDQFGKLKDSFEPGSDTITINTTKERLVLIPTSNRFYMVNRDRTLSDPGAPSFIGANDKNHVPVETELQVRFVFNRNNICEWFAQHGKRNSNNGDLLFNAPGQDGTPCGNQNRCWAKWLNENMGISLQRTVPSVISNYNWQRLKENWDVNANDSGDITGESGGSTWAKIEQNIGKIFTDDMNSQLGSQFFCGTNYDPTKPDVCPQMQIQIIRISPADPALSNAASETASAQADADQAKLRAQIEQDKLKAEQVNQAVQLEAKRNQAEKAALDAQIKNAQEIDLCKQLAAINVNCAEYLAAKNGVGSGGTSINVNGGKP